MKEIGYSLFLVMLLSCTSIESKMNSNFKSIQGRELADTVFNFDKNNLKDIENSFKFLRSYVSYFYLVVAENKEVLSSYKNLMSYRGFMMGDAHIENFGYLLNDVLQTQFTANDFDDFGTGVIYLDLLRFSVGVKLYLEKKTNLDQIYQFYLKGIKNESVPLPEALVNLMKISLAEGSKIKKRLEKNKKFSSKDGQKVNKQEEVDLTSYIKNKYPLALVLDLVKNSKNSGGSAGSVRFQVLMKLAGAIVHLELKEQKESSIVSTQLEHEKMSPLQKVAKAFDFYFGEVAQSIFYDSTNIKNLPMLVRPKFVGNVGVDLSAIKQNEIESIILYESWLLGQLHIKNTSLNIDNYLVALNKNFKNYLRDTENLAAFFDKKFRQLAL